MEGQHVRIPCTRCGGDPKNHVVLMEHLDSWEVEDGAVMSGVSIYQICKCAGCDDVRFRTEFSNSEDWDPRTGEAITQVSIHPVVQECNRSFIDIFSLPDTISRIYRETVLAFNVGALLLAGGGLRTIVEALCQDKNVPGDNLQAKIDNLAQQGYLAIPQATLLHEERYLGNAALHEMVAPSRLDVEDGFDIIDTLLKTIYVLPDNAERLRLRRTRQASS